jgi:hypothetical protein
VVTLAVAPLAGETVVVAPPVAVDFELLPQPAATTTNPATSARPSIGPRPRPALSVVMWERYPPQ